MSEYQLKISVFAPTGSVWPKISRRRGHHPTTINLDRQVAQLSQRDRAVGWVSYGQKWKTGPGRQYLRTI